MEGKSGQQGWEFRPSRRAVNRFLVARKKPLGRLKGSFLTGHPVYFIYT